MTSYAVTARIQPVSPRLRDRERAIAATPSADADEPGVIVVGADEGRHRLPGWDDLARLVSETMFFTLDPESWR